MSTKRRGLRPSKERIAEMARKGYATPAAIAKKFGIALSTAYLWRTQGLEPVDGVPAVVRTGRNVWLLVAAVERRLMIVEA